VLRLLRVEVRVSRFGCKQGRIRGLTRCYEEMLVVAVKSIRRESVVARIDGCSGEIFVCQLGLLLFADIVEGEVGRARWRYGWFVLTVTSGCEQESTFSGFIGIACYVSMK